ncbi:MULTISPECIES: DUF5819 family protein [unclassified Streptomyces]|uniref:DUF5819 family protein n=1 Tax=unclassified Streptomyces TaxID=2593676 RepID=UPI0035D55350
MESYEQASGTEDGAPPAGPPGRSPQPAAVRTRSGQPAPQAPTGPGADPADPAAHRPPPAGVAGLSTPYRVLAAVCAAGIASVACVHLAMVFLHVAPSNTLTKRHGDAVQAWVYPEFEQNWKLFAPNPLQQNISVEARAEYTDAGGSRRTSDWINLTERDAEAIRGNLLPSHIHQNQLRRGWDFYLGAHAEGARPDTLRARLSERYLRRIAMQRLEGAELGGPVQRIQLRSSSQAIEPPSWSPEKVDTRPVYNVQPWWTVTAADLPGGVTGGRTEEAR